jgi:hypothetical protein
VQVDNKSNTKPHLADCTLLLGAFFLENKMNNEEIIFDGWVILPLEKATDEYIKEYNKRARWGWIDAIYVLQGYKPHQHLGIEQLKYHFPELMNKFALSIATGEIGAQIKPCGEIDFVASPDEWKIFYEKNA